MWVKAETIKIGGFGVPPTYISEAFSLREKFKLVDHWRRRHFSMLPIQMNLQRQFFENKLNAEEIDKETIYFGVEVDSGNKKMV